MWVKFTPYAQVTWYSAWLKMQCQWNPMKYLKTHYSRMSRHRIFKLGTSRGIHSIDTWCVRSQNAGAGARVGGNRLPPQSWKIQKVFKWVTRISCLKFFWHFAAIVPVYDCAKIQLLSFRNKTLKKLLVFGLSRFLANFSHLLNTSKFAPLYLKN